MFWEKENLENLSTIECFVALNALGFNSSHYSCIKKLGGVKNFLYILLKAGFDQNISLSKQKFLNSLKSNLEKFLENGGTLVHPKTPNTKKLFSLSQSPLVFFARNFCQEDFLKPQVAIVGSRDATDKALDITFRLAKTLAQNNIRVVSGGAIGVDLMAHSGSINHQGESLAILGNCVEFSKDERPRRLLQLHKNFPSLTPFCQSEGQRRFMFVKRNIFIASLADVVVVVQGKEGSGTLHTANFAANENIPLYVLPWDLDNPLSYVSVRLLQQKKAKLLLDIEGFTHNLLKNMVKKDALPILPQKSKKETLPELLALIEKYDGGLSLSEIVSLSRKDLSEVQNTMLDYELEGLVKKRGAQFVINTK